MSTNNTKLIKIDNILPENIDGEVSYMQKLNSNKDISISMLIDNGLPNSYDNYINEFKPLPLKSSINIDERKIYQWVSDSNITNCYHCNIKFTITNRKHHCRNCGKIFCNDCSNHFLEIPANIKTVVKEKNYLDYKTYMNLLKGEKLERVCSRCNEKIQELKELDKTINFMELLPLTIFDYKNMLMVCKSWNKIAKYYLSSFREIQYNLPDHRYSKKEQNILWLNREYLSGHSKWILQLILASDWDNIGVRKKEELISIIKSQKRVCSCRELMCSRDCNETLQLEDVIIILSKRFTYCELMKYMIGILYNCNQTELWCYLSYLVNTLNFYKDYSNISEEIENFLIKKTKNSIALYNQLFWSITQNIHDNDNSNYFIRFRQKVIKNLDKSIYRLFQNGYNFTHNLIKIADDNNGKTMLENIRKYLNEYHFESRENFYLPVDFNKSFSGIDINHIRIINSKTKPIILPCKYDDNSVYDIMLKKDDLRKEEIMMKIIKLMDILLKRDTNIDFQVTTYNILAISDEYGYIEFVPNSYTLYSIREEHGFSIQNFILERNREITIHEFRNKFVKSCAFYCVATYLLGIGDRHLDNIMITNDGKLFHIDFGYILGDEPKPLCPEIRITPEMIDGMGGLNSQYYEQFKEYCGIAYNCLRRHSSIFYILLSSLPNYMPPIGIDIEKIKYHILNKFIPGENYYEALQQFKYKIDINNNTYGEGLIDYFHKRYKSSSGSSNEEVNIIDNALKIGNTLKERIVSGIEMVKNSNISNGITKNIFGKIKSLFSNSE